MRRWASEAGRKLLSRDPGRPLHRIQFAIDCLVGILLSFPSTVTAAQFQRFCEYAAGYWGGYRDTMQVHNLFVGQNRIRLQSPVAQHQKKNNRSRAEQEKASGPGVSRFQCMSKHLNPAKQHEDDDNHQDESQPSRRIIAPVSAMWPCGNRAY